MMDWGAYASRVLVVASRDDRLCLFRSSRLAKAFGVANTRRLRQGYGGPRRRACSPEVRCRYGCLYNLNYG